MVLAQLIQQKKKKKTLAELFYNLAFKAFSLDFNPATAANASTLLLFINAYQNHVLLIKYIHNLIRVTTLLHLQIAAILFSPQRGENRGFLFKGVLSL